MSSAPADFNSLEQAAEWYATLRSDDASERDQAAWRQWLAERPQHRSAWQHIEAIGQRFETLRQPGEQHAAAAGIAAARQPMARRRALNRLAVIAGTGLLGWSAWRHAPLQQTVMAWAAEHRTGTGEIRDLQLTDGTRVWLNTASALDVDYQPSLRRLKLVAGEVLIQTAHEAERHFVVDTAQGRVRALGTRFTLRQAEGETLLSVYEGAVEIKTASSGQQRVIAAGSQARFTADTIATPSAADPAREAWSRGVLLADELPLRDLIAELARYKAGHLGVSPEIGHLRVMGAYPLRDPERALSMIEEALPVRVKRTLPWWVTVEAR
ncbi:MAG: FecR domain-containing protein [Rhizobacter sp.]